MNPHEFKSIHILQALGWRLEDAEVFCVGFSRKAFTGWHGISCLGKEALFQRAFVCAYEFA